MQTVKIILVFSSLCGLSLLTSGCLSSSTAFDFTRHCQTTVAQTAENIGNAGCLITKPTKTNAQILLIDDGQGFGPPGGTSDWLNKAKGIKEMAWQTACRETFEEVLGDAAQKSDQLMLGKEIKRFENGFRLFSCTPSPDFLQKTQKDGIWEHQDGSGVPVTVKVGWFDSASALKIDWRFPEQKQLVLDLAFPKNNNKSDKHE
ncbi:MAG: hypothetical protein H7A33_00435 [Deltaproteobacteria bacterium]|nr:hypothetical protein [Deltaproteobacteria bacterium]